MKIQQKLNLLISFSLVFVLMINIIISFISIGSSVESSISNFSKSIVSNANKNFNQKEYAEWIKNPKKNKKYDELREELNDIRIKNSSLYLYTLTVEDEKLFIMIDGFEKGNKLAAPIKTPTTATTYKDVKETFERGVLSSTAIVNDPKYGSYLSAFAPIKDENGKIIGILGSDIDATVVEEIKKQVTKDSLKLIIGINGIILVVFVLISFLLFKRFLKPINELNNYTKEITNGNLDINDLKIKTKDELGQLINSFNKMKNELQFVIKKINEGTSNVNVRTEELSNILEETNATIGHISRMVSDISEGAVEQVSTVQKSSDSIGALSQNIESLLVNIENIDQSAKTTLSKTNEGGILVSSNITQMHSIQEKVNELVKILQFLEKQSKDISEKTENISDIAKQTEFLAFNAKIEASKAGDNGVGFNIVADEVRKLSEETALSASSIKESVRNIQVTTISSIENVETVVNEVQKGIGETENTGKLFRNIQDSIKEVKDNLESALTASEDISEKTKELKSDMKEIEDVAETISSKTQNASAAIEEQSASMHEVANFSSSLLTISKELKESTSKFKG